ncbi:MAG: hypothetical protein KDA24_24480 [Deltaproteobacteria bacterium]|nr:hypothetical protein [Deltaproteobacteria bacterium]
MRSALLLVLAATLVACPTPSIETLPPCEAVGGTAGLVDGTPVNPFPSFHVTASTPEGCAVRIPEDALPVGIDSNPIPVARLDVRDGFSAGQTSFWRPGVAIDPATLPRWDDPGGGLQPDASVQMWDLDAGVRLPAFAEVDAYPAQADADRAVLVRPLAPLPFGARVAVVVRDGVRSPEGEAVAPVAAFSAILSGAADSDVQRHYADLLSRLEGLGQDPAHVVLAWDFPVGTRANITAPLDVVIDTMRAELPAEPSFAPAVSIDAFLDRDTGGAPASGLWRELRGSVQLTHFLFAEDDDATDDQHDAGVFRLDAAGLPTPRALDEAFFLAVVPESVRDAAPGTVPVVVFGHGIFSSPQDYLAAPNDPNATVELLDRLGAIGIGGEWRGLTERDRPDAIRVAVDLGRFPLLTDKMVQGVSNQMAMPRLMRTQFRDHEAFLHEGGESLVDPSRMYYFGISLGGIEGLTLLANTEQLDHAVLHVPGSTWSTMLERSTNWNAFEPFVIDHVFEASDRQLLYTVSQLLWDPVDPVNHYPGLAGKSALMQVSVGDEQVPNFTAELLARGAGIPQVVPAVTTVPGLTPAEAPLGPDASGYMQFDPQKGLPPFENRPAEGSTDAHTSIRKTDEVMSQVQAFFTAGAEGTIEHPCGGAPCVLDVP